MILRNKIGIFIVTFIESLTPLISHVLAAERPGMAFELSRDGFDRFTQQVLLPWVFASSEDFTVGGLTYNKLTFDDARFRIEPPDFGDASVIVAIGGYDNSFLVTLDHFNLSISSSFDFRPKKDPQFKGTANIYLYMMTAHLDVVITTRLDEATGDYYPYLDMPNLGLDFAPDAEMVDIVGGTSD